MMASEKRWVEIDELVEKISERDLDTALEKWMTTVAADTEHAAAGGALASHVGVSEAATRSIVADHRDRGEGVTITEQSRQFPRRHITVSFVGAASSCDLRPVHRGLTSCSPPAPDFNKRLVNFLPATPLISRFWTDPVSTHAGPS